MDNSVMTYINEKVKNDNDSNNIDMQYNVNQKIFELSFDIEIPEVDTTYKLVDNEGTFSEGTKAVLRETICFYDRHYSFLDLDDYLYVVLVSFDDDIEVGYIDALLKQINILATTGSTQIREFLLYDTESEFQLEWPTNTFEETIDTLKNTKRYDFNLLTFDFE